MTVETTLQSGLSTATGVMVFPVMKGQQTPLAGITYKRISFLPRRTQSGKVSLSRARYQIDILDENYGRVRSLAELTKGFFEINQTQWELSTVVNEQETNEDNLFRVIIDVYIDYV